MIRRLRHDYQVSKSVISGKVSSVVKHAIHDFEKREGLGLQEIKEEAPLDEE
jgi:hypothetical protein